MSHRLGDPQPFVPEGTALGEHAQLGMVLGEGSTGEHGGQEDLTEALAAPRPVEERHGLPEAVDRPTIVALGLVGDAEVWFASACRTPSPSAVASARARWPAAMAWSYAPMSRNSLTETARPVLADEDRRGPREGLSLAQTGQDTPVITNGRAPSAARAGDRWPARACRASPADARGPERLLEGPHGLAVGRPRHGLLPRLPAVGQGLVPHLAPQGMVGQAFDLLGQPVSGERLEGLDDARMERPPALLQETAVRHLVGEGMLEGILRSGNRLVS